MFDQRSLDFLDALMATHSPSGFELASQRVIADYLSEAGLASEWDVHGNLHTALEVGAKRTCVIDAHCDEIGFLVNAVDSNGRVSVIANGGVTPQTVLGERIEILGKAGIVNGVFGVRPPHLMSADDKDKLAPKAMNQIWVDIGASSREEALEVIEIGSPAVIASPLRKLVGSRISCRGLDDKIGAFIAAEVMRRLVDKHPGVNVHFVGSVQEELGLIGGANAAQALQPDMGICLDVGFATDLDAADQRVMGDIKLGAGPILGVGPLYNQALANHLKAMANVLDISLQPQVRARAAGNNAYSLRMQGGAAVALISIPLRYMHSPVEVVDLKDVEAIVDLLTLALHQMNDTLELRPAQPVAARV